MRPKPHIALCLEYSILAFGGTEVLVRELIRGLHDDYTITLVSADEHFPLPLEGMVTQHISFNPAEARDAAMELAKTLKRAGVRFAHFHLGGNFCWGLRRYGESPMLHAARLGVPVITTNHGFFSPIEGYCAFYRPRWMKLALFPMAWLSKLQGVSAVRTEIAVSENDLRELQRWYWPQRAKFRRIYHSQLTGSPPPFTGERTKRILCVGTIADRKGQAYLADAFIRIGHRFPNWTLDFLGRDPAGDIWNGIAERAKNAGIGDRVRMLKERPYLEVAKLMQDSEVFAMPSILEGLGLTLQEALFNGCACIATRCGGPEDLITDNENGLLVKKGDAEALAGGLETLLSSQELREKFKRRGPESVIAKGMTAAGMIASYKELYQEFLIS